MNLINWTPFQDSDGFFNRYFDMLGPAPTARGSMARAMDWRPSVDISETKKHYLIKVELPEVDKDDVEVSVDNGMLTISGERRYENEEEDETRHRIERIYGKFSRSFALPTDADNAKITAKTKNGVLKVDIPKTKVSTDEPKKISID